MTTALVHSQTPVLEARSTSVEALAGQFLAAQASPQTVAAYRADLAQFFGYCAEWDVQPLAIRRNGVDAYRLHLEGLGRQPSTIARKLASLASFYEYAIDADACSANPVGRIKRPKGASTPQRIGVDADGLKRLLEAASADVRDFALVALLAGMGLRVSEACNLEAGNLGFDSGKRVMTITRKGAKRQRLAVPAWVSAAIDDALGGRPGRVLQSNDGGNLDRHDAARVVRRLANAAGLEQVTPHVLRHTFVTLALDAGAPLHKVQDAAGHADPRTTQAYNDARESLNDTAFDALGTVVDGFGTFRVLTARPSVSAR